MEEKEKVMVKWAQKDVETSNNLLYNNTVRETHDCVLWKCLRVKIRENGGN